MCGIGCEMKNGDFFDDVGVILLVNGDKVILMIFLVYLKPLESISVCLVVKSWKLVLNELIFVKLTLTKSEFSLK